MMELTHIHKNRITLTSLRAWFRQFLVTFINENADVFEALARQATPFGGNWLTNVQYSGKPERNKLDREQLTAVQQQLDELNRIVTRLSGQIDSSELVAPTPTGTTGGRSAEANTSASSTREVGINRFRALQTRP